MYEKVTKKFKRKTLVDEIKSILQQYPDDGQIFKEIIQNAEDAGATEVVFVYDKNDDRGKQLKLSKDTFGKHQGPSLFAYNNARFDEGDWEGIISLGISKKANDALKVGRFGLGFKSVFHLTDMPSVASGATFAYLDPLEDTLGEEVSVLDLDPGKLAAAQQYDDFNVFHRLGQRFWKPSNSTDGTMFRFPLRQEKSSLSAVCYDQKRFERLMAKFMKEAYLTMMFLKYVRSIKIYTIEENSSKLNEVYAVSLSDECHKQYHKQKQEFVDIVNRSVSAQAFDKEQKLDHELELMVSMNGHSSTYRYAISELFGFRGRNEEFTGMMRDEELSYIPLIATAYPLSPNDPGGHIFSGLPIPLQSQCMNGMPVHVNGFFALGQDRKDLKWKTISTDDSNDKTVNWNIHLIQELLPLAYSNLIQFLIRLKTDSEIVYKAWPIQQHTDSKWRMFLGRFYGIMMNVACMYVPQKTCWSTPDTVKFLKKGGITVSQFKAIEKFLSMAGQNVCSPLTAVMECLSNVSWIDKRAIQGYIIKNQGVYASLAVDEKCLVLSYAVTEASDLTRMIGKNLLPLVDGKYFQLTNNQEYSYYLPTLGHGKELLTSTERVLDVGFFAADNQLLETIKKIVRQGMFNMVVLESTRSVINAVKATLPSCWQESYEKTVKLPENLSRSSWLSDFTLYRRRNRIRFSELEGMPFIQVSKGGNWELSKISTSFKPMTSNIEVGISSAMKSFLQRCGVWFVESSMSQEDLSSLLNEGYVLQPTSMNVLDQLGTQCKASVVLNSFAMDGNILRNEMGTIISQNPNGKLPNVCYDLPLFKGYRSSVYRTARDTVIVEKLNVPEDWNPSFANIVFREEADLYLTSKLQVKSWSFEDVCRFIVNKWNKLQHQEQISFSTFFLQRCASVGISGNLQKLMSDYIKVLDCDGNGVCNPKHLFQKTAQLESFFFGDRGKFPLASYNMEVLKRFGLRSSSSLTIQDVNTSIKDLNQMCGNDGHQSQKLLKKVNAILNVIMENNLNSTSLLYVPWVPVATIPPYGYPENLIWYGNNNTRKQNRRRNYVFDACNTEPLVLEYLHNIYNETHQDLIGSVSHVIHPVILQLFNSCFKGTSYTSKVPDVASVMNHLKNVVKCYTDDEKGDFTKITLKIYTYLSQRSPQVVNIALSEGLDVWQGNGFVPYEKIITSNVCALLDLAPYFYVPPPKVLANFGPILEQLNCNVSESDVYIKMLEKLAEHNDQRHNSSRDWQLAFRIVTTLANNYPSICEERKSKIFVPVESKGLQLQPLDLCYYHDFDKEVEYRSSLSKNHILHRDLSKELAKKLKVPSLVTKVLSGNTSKLFKPWGQKEPLTLKLNRLLEDYQDGLAIVKELIQNADDAGATEVKFLYDQRSNDDFRSHLIDPQMKEWQGPALWVYNNQMFSEEDFENITKLNAGTKEYDTTKIGKFGLGFNSVYHLTDVPSFLSSDSLVIFDPHTKYLGEAFPNEPGVRIPIAEENKKEELSNFKDQFKVYHDVFGARLDFSSSEPLQPYNGTLFRLPLRTSTTSAQSQIKKMAYTEKEMKRLLKKLEESLNTLILFTQNVSSVSVYRLSESSSSPKQRELEFSVKKVVETLSAGYLGRTILSIANEELAQFEYRHSSYQIPQKNLVELVTMTTTTKGHDTTTKWMNFSTIGSQDTYRFAVNNKGHIPCGGISWQFKEDESGVLKPVQLNSGYMFCFLPLPIQSEIPVHVNGAFDISRDRQNLHFLNEDAKDYGTPNWNDLLAVDISEAYYNLFVYFKDHCQSGTIIDFLSCFPNEPPAKRVSKQILKTVLSRCLVSNDNIIPVRLADGTTWVNWNQLKVLNFKSPITPIYISFLNWYYKKQGFYICVDLPSDFKEVVRSMGFQKAIANITISRDDVYQCFLDSMNDADLDKKSRDIILDDLLKQKLSDRLQEKLKETFCISTVPNGRLRKPSELVLKDSKVSNLYTEADEVFPDVDEKHFRLLAQLGANKLRLPWHMLLERAKSIEIMQANGRIDHFRSKSLLSLLGETTLECPEDVKLDLLNVKFLKVLQKPEGYLFPTWYGFGLSFHSPNKMYSREYQDVCSCTALLCEDEINKKTADHLRLNRTPFVEEMVGQAKAAALVLEKEPTSSKIHRIMDQLYEQLSDAVLRSESASSLEELQNVRFVRTSATQIVEPSKVFINANLTITGHVHILDPAIKRNEKWLSLMKAIGVEADVTLEHYMGALQGLKNCYGDQPVSEEHLKEILSLVPDLCDSDNLENSKLFLPDSNKVLQEFGKLCYKDVHWLPDEEGVVYINDGIPRDSILKLDVKSLRCDTFLKNAKTYNGWLKFGQSEKLTTRIANLLGGYSEPIDVFKEMFQNADDSGATEIEFILDKRHHKQEKVFSDKWKPLQGPALLVVNNGKFTKADLDGIQALGSGNKNENPLATGKYGVGFNSVYGITDCPVLLTKVDSVGDVMAIFDPNLNYAEGASPEAPGSMIENAREFLKTYSDVTDSFLFNEYDSSKKTLFRLPLRDKAMSESSEISSKTVNTSDIQEIFGEVQKNANYFLLFLNNINSIRVKVIEEDGSESEEKFIGKSYGISKNRENKFKEFRKNYSKKLGNLTSLMNSEKRLKRKVCVQRFKGEQLIEVCHWDIIEQCGFSNMTEVPDSVKRMIQNNDLHLIPKGGIAKHSKEKCCELCEDMEKTPLRNFSFVPDSGRVFCTLPLQVTTGIPVIVNGNFILDYETRRSLWSSDADSVKRSWNNAILKSCVLPSYLEYLTSIVEEIEGMYGEESESGDSDSDGAEKPDKDTSSSLLKHAKMAQQIQSFYKCFPSTSNAYDSYWKYLTDEFYKAVYNENKELLAVHRKEEIVFCKPKNDFLEYNVDEPVEHSPSPSYLLISKDQKKNPNLLTVLKSAFINTDKLPGHVSRNFEEAECSLAKVTPQMIRERLALMKDKLLPLGGDIWKVDKTIFRTVENVKTLLTFCLKDSVEEKTDSESQQISLKGSANEKNCSKDQQISLNNIPLCLRADETLTLFSRETPVYLTRFSDLFEEKKCLFLHKKIYSTMKYAKHINQSCFKAFTLQEFANLLSDRFAKLKDKSCPVVFNESTEVTEKWIIKAWEFIVSCQTKNKENESSIDFNPIKDWPLVLSQKTGGKYLLPICRRKEVLYMAGQNHQLKLVKVLRKFGCYEPVYHPDETKTTEMYPRDVHNLSIFGSLQSLGDTLDALVMANQNSALGNVMEVADAEEILKHLQILTENEKEAISQDNKQKTSTGNEEGLSQDKIGKLRSLPLFEKWNGKVTRGNGDVVVLPHIPLDGIEKVEERCQKNFLKRTGVVKELYTSLQFIHYEWTDIYLHFILPNADILDDKELMSHIKFIKSVLNYLKEPVKGTIISYMSNMKIFQSKSGERRICREMYHPENEIFNLMQSDRDFPAEEYCSPEWLVILAKFELVTKLTSNDFLKYARNLESEDDLGKVEKVSILLCEKLKEEANVTLNKHVLQLTNPNFLSQLRSIRFLIPTKFKDDLESISESRNSKASKICYEDSVTPKHKHLVWTTEFILPHYAVGNGDQWKTIAETLKIKAKAQTGFTVSLDPDSVIRNIKSITNCQDKLECKTTTCKEFKDGNVAKTYLTVLCSLYRYLQQRIIKEKSLLLENLVADFSTISCILVNKGKQIEVPSKVLLNDICTVPPYLNKADARVGQFYDTLEKMGCSNMSTANNYIGVLREVRANSRANSLEPNEVKVAKDAVYYLSVSLQKNKNGIETEIYLPTVTFVKKDSLTLTISQECLYVDDFSTEDRLQEFDKPLLLYDYGVNETAVNKQLMKRLPEEVRPRVLSECIKEQLSCTQKCIQVGADHISNKIKSRLTDPQFKQGLARLFLHENHEDVCVDDHLSGVEVHVLEVVKTHLTFDGEPIPNSECKKNIFLQHDDDALHLYFDSSSDPEIITDVADALLQKFGDILKSALLLPSILSIPVDSIAAFLDKKRIKRDATVKSHRTFGQQPDPGVPVPVELHALLRHDLSCFEIGEYVGIDSAGEGKHFVYGIIKELDNDPDLTKRTLVVQTGGDHFEKIPVYMIYKFDRRYEKVDATSTEEEDDGTESNALLLSDVVDDDFVEENKHRSYEEIIEEIRGIIRNLKGELESKRKVVVRRLYLTWHPDKHPNATKELATKVFQFLQNELKTLDENYESEYQGWNSRASNGYSQYRDYTQNFQRTYGGANSRDNSRSRRASSSSDGRHSGNQNSWSSGCGGFSYAPPRFSSSNPQPSEAKRWYSQAKHDLEAALQHPTTSHEWKCYIAHQAAEKAIKAALFTKDYQRFTIHDLRKLATGLLNEELIKLAEKLEELIKSADSARYPSSWPVPLIPHGQYSQEDADKAIALATKILELVQGTYM